MFNLPGRFLGQAEVQKLNFPEQSPFLALKLGTDFGQEVGPGSGQRFKKGPCRALLNCPECRLEVLSSVLQRIEPAQGLKPAWKHLEPLVGQEDFAFLLIEVLAA